MLKKSKILVVLMLGLVFLTSCGNNKGGVSQNKEIKIVDDFGNKVALDKEVKKIVSLSPSTTEVLFALGLDEKIVGVSDYCDYPAKALEKEKIGGFADANLEKIIGLSPDLVVSAGGEKKEANEILKNANIEVAVFDSGTIEEVYSQIERIGILTGREDAAEKLVGDMKKKEADIVTRAKEIKNKEKVFYEIWHDPLTTAGKGSFMDELITLSGGINIAGDMDKPYPEISVEKLIEENPSIYLTTDGGVGKTVETIKTREGYANIEAVKNDRVYILDANIVSRPGPRIVDALEIVYEIISEK